MSALGRRWFGALPEIRPEEGTTVLEPPAEGRGNWVGAPTVAVEGGRFYLGYRIRTAKERGHEYRVAVSEDGVKFEDIWSARKEQFEANSIERGSLIRGPDGAWRLYISYEERADGRWKIDLLEAGSPDGFDPETRVRVIDPDPVGAESVKDPWVGLFGGLYCMFVTFSPRWTNAEHTALAVSHDGREFEWQGEVFGPGETWDRNQGRITSVVYISPLFVAFYDGRERPEQSTEERAGWAVSLDLLTFDRVTVKEPAFKSPHGTGSMRYIEALVLDGELWLYYEWARPDGSHELRLSRARLP